MFSKSKIQIAITFLLSAPLITHAEIEVSGFVKNETAFYTGSGQLTGQATTTLDNTNDIDSGDTLKSETTAKLFINGDIGEESSWHAEINGMFETQGVNGTSDKTHVAYTQQDWLRELYIDTTAGDWDVRLGKQQVVWGTADGIKLLDVINPTDFTEFNQNGVEDARIPVWMANFERNVGDNGNIQFIVSQAKKNNIAGLNASGAASGTPFVFKGVDSITGPVNGFLNISAALGKVANTFSNAAAGGGFDLNGDNAGDAQANGLAGFGNLSVDGFAGNNTITQNGDTSLTLAGGAVQGGGLLNFFANDASRGANANLNITNLTDTTWAHDEGSDADAAFEYMANATFTTFNTFAGTATASGIVSRYVRDLPKDSDLNTGFRFRGNTDSGLNYSLNYLYNYDPNPAVTVGWYDATTGDKLVTELVTHDAAGGGSFADRSEIITADQVPTTFAGDSVSDVTVLLQNSVNNNYYGRFDFDPLNVSGLGAPTMSTNQAELRFTESQNRIHNIGASLDTSLNAGDRELVLRGEFLFQKDTNTIVVNKQLLSIGDLENALTNRKADMFKYVLGVDTTVAKNMLVSGQFIQFRNLDHVETNRTCTTQTGKTFDCSTYTGDQSSLHLTNGLQKAEKNKEFYSLFLSKPFGNSQEHRWNNIFIYEENGGKWNRFDVEYSFSDELIGTTELNYYWGDENTTFGQFNDSSSIQVGLKYLLD